MSKLVKVVVKCGRFNTVNNNFVLKHKLKEFVKQVKSNGDTVVECIDASAKDLQELAIITSKPVPVKFRQETKYY